MILIIGFYFAFRTNPLEKKQSMIFLVNIANIYKGKFYMQIIFCKKYKNDSKCVHTVKFDSDRKPSFPGYKANYWI